MIQFNKEQSEMDNAFIYMDTFNAGHCWLSDVMTLWEGKPHNGVS